MTTEGGADSNLLLDIVAVAGKPVSLRALAAALDVSEDAVIAAASDLVSQGSLIESAAGYAVPEGTAEPSPVRAGGRRGAWPKG